MTARKAASNKDMNGLKVINLGAPTAASQDAVRQVDLEANSAYDTSRANHSGTQLAATISNFDTAVRTNRLDQMTAPTGSVAFGTQKLINLLDPTALQDAATKNYVDVGLAGLVSGQTLKGAVKAVSTVNVNIASAPATIDGITPTAGDVFLLVNQTTGLQGGPYVWTATAAVMNRATNWDSQGEAVIGSYWIVTQGSKADSFALMTNDTFTLNTTTPSFIYSSMVAASTTAVEQDLGNGALTSFTVNHNFGTRAVNVVVYRVASPFDEIDVYVEHTDINNVTIKPDSTWSTSEFHVVVSKS
jgi:hypothetical protein